MSTNNGDTNHGYPQRMEELTRAVAQLSVAVSNLTDRQAASEQRHEQAEQKAMAAAAATAATFIQFGYERGQASGAQAADPEPPPEAARRRGGLWLVPVAALFAWITTRPLATLAVVAAASGLVVTGAITGGVLWPHGQQGPPQVISGPTRTVTPSPETQLPTATPTTSVPRMPSTPPVDDAQGVESSGDPEPVNEPEATPELTTEEPAEPEPTEPTPPTIQPPDPEPATVNDCRAVIDVRIVRVKTGCSS